MINHAGEESISVVEDVALWRLMVDDPSITEPLGFAVGRCFDEKRDAATRRDGVVGETCFKERLQWIAMIIAMNAVELIFN